MGSSTSKTADYDAPAYAVLAIFLALTTFAVVGRAVSRHTTKSHFGTDDALSYLSYVTNTASTINQLTAVTLGAYNLQKQSQWTPEQAASFQDHNLTTAILYVITIACAKLSVLFLYHRIFGFFDTLFKIGWIFNFLVIFPAWFFATFGVLIWLQIDSFAFTSVGNVYGSASLVLVNAISDIMVLVLPIRSVLRLQLSWPRKVEIIGVFSLGLLTTAISIARAVLNFLQATLKSNPAYSTYTFTILSLAESSAATLCSCIPVSRPFLFKLAAWANSPSLRNLVTRFSSSSTRSSRNSSQRNNNSEQTISRTVAVNVESLPLHQTGTTQESLKKESVLGIDNWRDPVTTISGEK